MVLGSRPLKGAQITTGEFLSCVYRVWLTVKRGKTFLKRRKCWLFSKRTKTDWGHIVFGLSVRLFVRMNVYIGPTFGMVSDRAFICHICIPWGKTFSFVPKPRLSVKVKVKYQGHSFRKKMAVAGALVFHKHSLFFVFMSE